MCITPRTQPVPSTRTAAKPMSLWYFSSPFPAHPEYIKTTCSDPGRLSVTTHAQACARVTHPIMGCDMIWHYQHRHLQGIFVPAQANSKLHQPGAESPSRALLPPRALCPPGALCPPRALCPPSAQLSSQCHHGAAAPLHACSKTNNFPGTFQPSGGVGKKALLKGRIFLCSGFPSSAR